MRQLEYIDDIPMDAGVLANDGLFFIGRNARIQRGEMSLGPFSGLQEDPTHWFDINVWLTRGGDWHDMEDVPLLVTKIQPNQQAWSWPRVAWGSTGLLKAIRATDIRCDLGLAVFVRGKFLDSVAPIASQVLHIRGRYEG